jgi:hypothetical protein
VAPGAAILADDVYTALTEDTESGMYVGVSTIGGVECHQLALLMPNTCP